MKHLVKVEGHVHSFPISSCDITEETCINVVLTLQYVSLEHPLHIFGLDYFLVCAKAMGLHYFSNLVPDSNLSRRGEGGGWRDYQHS